MATPVGHIGHSAPSTNMARKLPINPFEMEMLNSIDRLNKNVEEFRNERFALHRNMDDMRQELYQLREARASEEFTRRYGQHHPLDDQAAVNDQAEQTELNEAFLAEPNVTAQEVKPRARKTDLDEWLLPNQGTIATSAAPVQHTVFAQNAAVDNATPAPAAPAAPATANYGMTIPPIVANNSRVSIAQSTPAVMNAHDNRSFYYPTMPRSDPYRYTSFDGNRRSKEALGDLPKFDGQSSLKIFKQQFTEVSYMSGWDTEAEVVFWLKGCLIGKASEVLYDACDNADVLWSRLESRFGDRLHLQRYQNALPARKRNRNEPLPDLASDIRKMADIVYSGIDFEQKEKLAITHFVNALDSPNACYDITDKKPKSLEEALAIAMNREIYFGKESAWGSSKGHETSQNDQYKNFRSNNVPNEPRMSAPIYPPQMGPPHSWNGPPANPWLSQHHSLPGPSGPFYPQVPPQPMQSGPRMAMAPPPPQPQGPWSAPPNPGPRSNGPKCKHCGSSHPSYVCQPCRFCGGMHYDNQCPNRGGNSRPIS
mgnify:FL=1